MRARSAQTAEPLDGPTVSTVLAAAREHNIAVVIGMAENDNGRFYNTTLLITGLLILAVAAITLLLIRRNLVDLRLSREQLLR